LVTDFRSTSDGLTRESSFSPKLQQNKKQTAHKPNDPASFRHLQINPGRALNSPMDPALHRPFRRAPEPDPRSVHLRIQSNPSENPNAGDATGTRPARAWLWGGGPGTLSATKSTTASAFSGAVRPPEEMPRQRSLRVGGGGGRAPSAADAAAEARGRAKHQARPLTGKTKTRACIAAARLGEVGVGAAGGTARDGGRRRRGGGGGDWRGGAH